MEVITKLKEQLSSSFKNIDQNVQPGWMDAAFRPDNPTRKVRLLELIRKAQDSCALIINKGNIPNDQVNLALMKYFPACDFGAKIVGFYQTGVLALIGGAAFVAGEATGPLWIISGVCFAIAGVLTGLGVHERYSFLENSLAYMQPVTEKLECMAKELTAS